MGLLHPSLPKLTLLHAHTQLLVSVGLVAQFWFHDRWMVTAVFALMGPNCVVFSTFAFAIMSQCVEDTKRAATSGVSLSGPVLACIMP